MKSAGMVKAGRDLVGWSQADLSSKSGLSLPTIQRMENPAFGPLRSSGANIEKIRAAFAAAGVTFISDGTRECVCYDASPAQTQEA
ncbi:helix-turn-helix transcriptional regulator [Methylobacterium sp. WL30]|uniref:helix-turn-helix domain-containing protein n=1 Tax=unclassified Methylobacterium TaxID=2615210 RepID=UPI0011C9DCF2|nr:MULTISPECIES: helix-turn-helix transcriptional regulator [unclassified Methylobacterium]RZL29170.1 MAG: XRE family transcriptional regulator [Sphingomonas sp.]TXN40138.1 helix-turn-helix transcriptional regulator [Methylobacterium sp. WL93]TXN49360.1 helix-turn-helix transcriptional regulator [Methylobacterium sp. WL119]TXN62548.1 helix-turn-helix transcriptional regulator [Methylobacterium sp. WL30]